MKKNILTIEFKYNKNILDKVEISQKIYKAFYKFGLEDISQTHKFRNHVEHLEVYEETLNIKMPYKPISIEVIFKILIVEKIKYFYYNIPSRIILKMYCIMNIEV